MLNKIFGKKKNENYFLEFDGKSAKEAKPETVKSTKQDKPVGTETTQAVTEANETVKFTPTQSKPTVSYDSPDWVKAIKNYSNQNSNGVSSSTENANFAGKYVTNNVSMSRRRPGPSLNKFKKIASEINK